MSKKENELSAKSEFQAVLILDADNTQYLSSSAIQSSVMFFNFNSIIMK